MRVESPEFPVGPYEPLDAVTDEVRVGWIDAIADLPQQLREAVDGLSESQLDTTYRRWTIRQIVHHIADSHVNSYIRFKWTLTENTPTIKAYDEGLWSDLVESRTGAIAPSLDLLAGLHARWVQLLLSLTSDDFDRAFVHPETGLANTLGAALSYYAWHGRHHMGQIVWLRTNQL